MKTTQIRTLSIIVILIAGLSLSGHAQTIVNITSNTSTSTYGTGAICTNCIINISPGVTLTINNTCSCNTCTFSGGTVNITTGSNFTLSGVDSFKNETVLLNKSFSPANVVFYGDTVAFNATMNLSGGRTTIDSSRVSVNANLTLAEGSFNKDSLHLNKNLTLSYGVDSFSNSHIDVANAVKITAAQTNISSTTFAFEGSSSMTVNYGLNSSNSNYYLASTSSISSANATTLSGDSVVLSGTTNKFTSGDGLTTTNTDIIMNGSAGKFTASSVTATGGSLTTATGNTFSSTYAVSLTNTDVNLTGSTFSGSQLTTTGGSFSAAGNSNVSSTYAVSFTNTPVSFTNGTFSGSTLTTSGSSFNLSSTKATITYADQFTGTAITMDGNSKLTGQSATLSSASLVMTGTAAVSVTYGYTSTGSQTNLNGNSTITVTSGSMSLGSGSFLQIGDGTLASGANVKLSGSMSVDNSSTLALADNNNYLNSTTSALSHNTFSCGGASPQHACATNYVYGCATITNNVGLGCTVLAEASINLTASERAPGTVALAWTDHGVFTAGRYEIQRSAGNDQWTTIATVAVDSNTTTHEYTDADAPSGHIDYRVARTGNDGATSYSTICSVTVTVASTSVGVHPNPAAGGRFYLTTASTGEIVVNVYTSTGQLLLHTALQGQTEYPIQLPMQTLSLSTIVVQTISGNNTRTFTMLVHP